MRHKPSPPGLPSVATRIPGSLRATVAVAAVTVLVAALSAGRFGTGLAIGAAPAAAASSAQPSTARAVLDRVREAVAAIRDASARLIIESVDERARRTRMVISAALIRQPAVVRLEILEPSALADQVYVIDFQTQRLQVYLPVTHQILMQPLERPASADAAAASVPAPALLSPEQLLDVLPSESSEPAVRLVGTEKAGGKTLYVLEASAPRPSSSGSPSRSAPGAQGSTAPPPAPAGSGLAGLLPIQPGAGAAQEAAYVRVWIDGSTWLATRVALYSSANKELASLTFADVRINRGLRPEALRQLPADAEVVEG